MVQIFSQKDENSTFTKVRLLGRFVNVHELQAELLVLMACMPDSGSILDSLPQSLAVVENRLQSKMGAYNIKLLHSLKYYLLKAREYRLIQGDDAKGYWLTRTGILCVRDHTARLTRHAAMEARWRKTLSDIRAQEANSAFEIEKAQVVYGEYAPHNRVSPHSRVSWWR